MSDFFNPVKVISVRKTHRCSYCGEPIEKGEQCVFTKGNWDGSWFESRMHFECDDELRESGDDEYIPYSNERPRVEK